MIYCSGFRMLEQFWRVLKVWKVWKVCPNFPSRKHRLVSLFKFSPLWQRVSASRHCPHIHFTHRTSDHLLSNHKFTTKKPLLEGPWHFEIEQKVEQLELTKLSSCSAQRLPFDRTKTKEALSVCQRRSDIRTLDKTVLVDNQSARQRTARRSDARAYSSVEHIPVPVGQYAVRAFGEPAKRNLKFTGILLVNSTKTLSTLLYPLQSLAEYPMVYYPLKGRFLSFSCSLVLSLLTFFSVFLSFRLPLVHQSFLNQIKLTCLFCNFNFNVCF